MASLKLPFLPFFILVLSSLSKNVGSGPNNFNANKFCSRFLQDRNYVDSYQDVSDCHSYFQCYYLSYSVVFGYHRVCPDGKVWSSRYLQCLPEGLKPCSDKCSSVGLSEKKKKVECYAGESCRQYFTCNKRSSEPKCCPEGTRFDESTCQCRLSMVCKDPCGIRGLRNLTQQVTAVLENNQCQDLYGNIIRDVDGQPRAFAVMTNSGTPTEPQYCPPTLEFDLLLCRCIKPKAGSKQRRNHHRKALIWMPFDYDVIDNSVTPRRTMVMLEAFRDSETSAVTGGGSLVVKNGGYIRISNLKTVDFHNTMSICMFFQCESKMNKSQHWCDSRAGLFSNNKAASRRSLYTVIIGVERFNRFVGQVRFDSLGIKHMGAALKTPDSGWNHVCVTYDASVLRLYIESDLVDAQYVAGKLFKSRESFVIGGDNGMGDFNGHIDDVLITDFVMTNEEIKAHYAGRRSFLIQQGFFLLNAESQR